VLPTSTRASDSPSPIALRDPSLDVVRCPGIPERVDVHDTLLALVVEAEGLRFARGAQGELEAELLERRDEQLPVGGRHRVTR
jgi:hypothetical protein